jgi:hypothetical protein
MGAKLADPNVWSSDLDDESFCGRSTSPDYVDYASMRLGTADRKRPDDVGLLPNPSILRAENSIRAGQWRGVLLLDVSESTMP